MSLTALICSILATLNCFSLYLIWVENMKSYLRLETAFISEEFSMKFAVMIADAEE